MSKQKQIKDTLEKYSQLDSKFDDYIDLIGENKLDNLKKIISEFKDDVNQDLDENRLLKIGVIGQIKRGKSSFLNALIFEGEDILPKAATPMTAALTKIKYSKVPSAVIEFYSVKEWENIEKNALEYEKRVKFNKELKKKAKNSMNRLTVIGKGLLNNPNNSNGEKKEITPDLKSANELFNMAMNNNLDVRSYLGKNETIEGEEVDDLISKFDEYVGANGKFTPIVKSTELSLNIESLKNIEIVDTPGMNDPIVSRGARTKEFMGKCDVVFFLSSLSQFLDQSDMEVLSQNLPSKGIKHISLIGTMFDNLLVEEGDKYDSLQQALPSLINRKNQEKRERVNNLEDKKVKELLEDKELIVTSSIWYNISKHFDDLSKDEDFHYKRLSLEYPEIKFSADMMLQLSQIPKAEQELLVAKGKKEEIIAERFENRMFGFKNGVRENISLINKITENQKEKLENGDVEKLKKRAKTSVKAVKKGKIRVEELFESYIIESERKFANLKSKIEDEKAKATELQVDQGTEHHSSTSGWWIFSSTTTWTTNYTYASVYDAVESLEQYVISAKKQIRKDISTLIDIKQFKRDLINNIEEMFDFSDDDFEPNDILLPVKNAVNRITIPNVEIDMDKHIDTIRDGFSNAQVRDSEVSRLKQEQSKVAKLIETDILKEVTLILNKIIDKLNHIKVNFIPEITKDMMEDVDKIEKQIKNKEDYLKRYDNLIKLLENSLMGV